MLRKNFLKRRNLQRFAELSGSYFNLDVTPQRFFSKKILSFFSVLGLGLLFVSFITVLKLLSHGTFAIGYFFNWESENS